jgi:putative MATE family efflux protein
VGHLGREQLDALAIATSALSIVAWLAVFLTTATTTAVARRIAQSDDDAAGRAVGAAYLVAAAWGVVTGIALIVVAPWVARLLGAHAQVLTGATGYLRASAGGLPFLYVSFAGNGHMVGLADTRTPLGIAVGANAMNVGLEVGLVFGAHLGLFGSAWGTVAAQAAAAAAYAIASRRNARLRPRTPGKQEIRELLIDGHRLSVRTIALGVVPLATTAVVARLGPVTLGGQQIAYRLWYLLSLSLDALAVPGQVFVSAAVGAGDQEAARLAGRRTLWLGLAAGCAVGLVTAALAVGAPALFTGDPAVRGVAVTGLLVSAGTQPLAALAFVLDGLILGISDYAAMRRAMIVAIVAFVPVTGLVLRFHWLGLPGVWAAIGLWLAARAALLGRRWAVAMRAGSPDFPRPASVVGQHDLRHADRNGPALRTSGTGKCGGLGWLHVGRRLSRYGPCA